MFSEEFHTHTNTQILQKKHHQLYEELFRSCPIVVSAPATLVWSPNYAVGPGGIGIVSKLPLRMYIGIEPQAESKVEFGPTKYYIPENDTFQDWDSTKCNPLLLRLLEQVSQQCGKTGGARLWSLTEIPWYRGLNIDPLYAAAAATAWLMYLGVTTPKEVAEFVSLPTDQLTGSKAFENIFRLAWRLESIILNGLADAHVIFATLIDSQYPVVFFRERDPILFDHYRDFGIEHPSSFYNISDGLFFRGIRFNELFQFDPNLAWPIDISLVFTGEEGDSQFTHHARGAFKVRLDNYGIFATQTLNNFIPKTFRQTPRFLEITQRNPGQVQGMNLFQIYREDSVVHSMAVFKTMYDLFQYGPAPHILHEFLFNQNICQHLLSLLDLSSNLISQALTLLRFTGNKYGEIITSRLIGPGSHGCLMVLGPANTLAPILAEALPLIKAETKKTTHCHWASWCDTNRASEGVRVEQCVEAGIYSLFTSPESVTVCEWNNGKIVVMLYTAEQWGIEIEKFDLLLNEKENRIFIRGRMLTSSEIHSAKQTIELFKHFFSRRISELSNESLPQSCYRSDRNQMESKIIRPLAGIIKKFTNKSLGLEIHGGLRSFKLYFQPDKRLRIGLIKRE